MWLILTFIGVSVFVLGLLQWARSGAALWQIRTIRREEASLSAEERKTAEGEVRRLEQATDRALIASFRILGFLAIATWLLLGVTILLDFFGIDWASGASIRARMYWNTPAPGVTRSGAVTRNDVLKNIGGSLRK